MMLRVVVDHGFGQNFFAKIPAVTAQVFLHECGNLIHIKLDAGDIGRVQALDFLKRIEKLIDDVFCV